MSSSIAISRPSATPSRVVLQLRGRAADGARAGALSVAVKPARLRDALPSWMRRRGGSGDAERADTEVCARFTLGAWAVSVGRWRAGMTGAIMNGPRPRPVPLAPHPLARYNAGP